MNMYLWLFYNTDCEWGLLKAGKKPGECFPAGRYILDGYDIRLKLIIVQPDIECIRAAI